MGLRGEAGRGANHSTDSITLAVLLNNCGALKCICPTNKTVLLQTLFFLFRLDRNRSDLNEGGATMQRVKQFI